MVWPFLNGPGSNDPNDPSCYFMRTFTVFLLPTVTRLLNYTFMTHI